MNLTKKLISFDTSKVAGQQTARAFLRNWCSEQSLACETIPTTEALYIQTQPNLKPEFAFVCHLDVVPSAGWKQAFKPLLKDGYLYGRGAVDDKGPLAICLETLLAFQNRTDINISCLIVNDEETQNLEIAEVLKQKIFNPNFCLVADGGTHTIFDIGQKGIISLSLTLTAEGGHSAFEETENSASLLLLQVIKNLNQFADQQKTHPSFKPTLVNVSRLSSEAVPYAFPSLATANLEIQFPPPQKLADWLAIIEKQKSFFPTLKIEIHFTAEPHLVTDKKILSLIQQPGNELITVGGVNLSKDLNLAGVLAIGHCPVTEYMGHCDDERIHRDDFVKGVAEYSELIHTWFKHR